MKRSRLVRKLASQLAGWLLFIACSIFYLISGYQTGDPLIFWGSLLFFIACLFFLLPDLFKLITILRGFHTPRR